MKRTSPLWGSISILIGVVIAILSLLRGNWANRRSERRFRGVGPVAHFHPAAPRLEIQPHVPAASGSTVSKAMTMLT